MAIILSTKKLSITQKQVLINDTIALIEEDFIGLSHDFETEVSHVDHAILTSQNSAKSVLKKNISIKNAYCVGRKATRILEENNINVVTTQQTSEQLKDVIIKEYNDRAYTFFCGNRRLDTLITGLQEQHITVSEIVCYYTINTSIEVKTPFDSVIFYSPSGVESYLSSNAPVQTAFCIGNTTASKVKGFENVIVSSLPNINMLLLHIKKYYQNL